MTIYLLFISLHATFDAMNALLSLLNHKSDII